MSLFNVPRYEEPENGENGHEENGRTSVWWLIFGMIFCGTAGREIASINFNWLLSPTNIRVFLTALLTAAGATMALILIAEYIAPPLWAWWTGQPLEANEAEPDTVEEDTPPARPAVAPPPRVNLPNGEQVRQVEQTAVIWANDHLINVGGETVDLNEYQVTREQWDMLVKARRRGKFPTISPNSLHDVLGIDRKDRASLQDSDAHRVIGLLEYLELIQDGGDRRPYVWTALGDSVLPPPRSQLSQGANQSSPVETTTAVSRLTTTGRLEGVGG